MATIDELQVQITANADTFKSELKSVQKELDNLNKTSSSVSKKMSSSFVALGSAVGNVVGNIITSAFRALASEMDDAITRLDTLNNFTKVMSNLGISSTEAENSINVLSDKLQGLPTTLDDVALSVQRLTSANGNIGASTEMFLALNNAIMAGGASTETQSTAIEQLSQAYAKGKPDMMEWRSMLTAMPAQLKQVASAMGYASSDELGEALRGGTVSMNEFMETMVKLNKEGCGEFKSFEEQARNATGGVATSITNLKTAISRGLANIMNAIGQTNISGFINGIASAIGTATNYVAAFVKVVITAINGIKTLFGTTSSLLGETATETDNISDNLSSVGTSADDVSDSIDDTTDSAKKLAKQLASFDEMNILKEDDYSSSDDSSTGTNVDLSGLDFDWSGYETTANSVIDSIYAKMMKVFGELDLSKWEKALITFKNGATKAFKIIENVGKSAWENLFSPLLKYVAENTLPDFIEGIGEALDNLDIESFTNSFDVFFSGLYDFLRPVLDIVVSLGSVLAYITTTLTNWVVPPALTLIGDALSLIGSLLQGIADGFMNVWETYIKPSLDQFSEFLEPIIADIEEMGKKIQECEPLMNALRTAGEVLGSALGVVFGIVVGAIELVISALVVAIDFVLHLPEYIVQFFQQMWDIVVSVVSAIGNFFTNIFNGIREFIGNVGNSIGNVFSNIWNGFKNGAENAWNGVKSVFSTVANFFGNIFSEAWNKVKEVFSTGGKIFDGIKDGIVNAFKTIVNAIIGGINKVVAVPFNAINGVLNGIRSIDILGLKPFEWVGTISVPQIPYLATGGVTSGATLAMIGEAGKEAVLPLENNTSWMDTLAEKIGGQHITVKIGEETILDRVVEGINGGSFMRGSTVLKI